MLEFSSLILPALSPNQLLTRDAHFIFIWTKATKILGCCDRMPTTLMEDDIEVSALQWQALTTRHQKTLQHKDHPSSACTTPAMGDYCLTPISSVPSTSLTTVLKQHVIIHYITKTATMQHNTSTYKTVNAITTKYTICRSGHEVTWQPVTQTYSIFLKTYDYPIRKWQNEKIFLEPATKSISYKHQQSMLGGQRCHLHFVHFTVSGHSDSLSHYTNISVTEGCKSDKWLAHWHTHTGHTPSK